METDAARIAVVIEDDDDIRNLVTAILREAGFTCIATADGFEGIEAVREHEPVLITLDVRLPGIDGFEVARRIRAFSNTYVIMLSARNDEIDTLMGLDAGADDYLTKPFRPRELRARIEAAMRRLGSRPARPVSPVSPAPGGSPGGSPVERGRGARFDGGGPGVAPVAGANDETAVDDWLSHNGLRISPARWLCELNGTQVELTRSEFSLLRTVVEGNRRVITKDSLALELRGDPPGSYVSDADRRSVEVHIANLRRKLHDPISAPRFVETIRGVGYRLTERRPGSS
ncbi:MAG: response regulator transcription factor [Microlunatus sp.]